MQKRYSHMITRSAALALLLVLALLAGCGGQDNTLAPTPAATGGSQGGGTAAVTAVLPAPATASATGGGAVNAAATSTPGANSAGSGSSGPGLDLTAFDVCGVLSQDEVLGLMPNAKFDGFPTDFDPTSGTKTCTYADKEGSGYLQMTLYTPNRWADEASVTGTNPQPVAGLGDEAVTETLKYAQVLAVLVKGRAAFLLTVNPVWTPDGVYDAGKAKDIAMKLAQIIIPRLR